MKTAAQIARQNRRRFFRQFFRRPIVAARNVYFKWLQKKRGSILIGATVGDYVNELLTKHEDEGFLGMMEETGGIVHADMQVTYDQGRFIETLAKATGAKKVLEIGTFRGVSAAFIARVLPRDGVLITCDKREDDAAIARTQWKKLGLESRIEMRLGLAHDVLKELTDERSVFDLVFLDADKANYREYFDLSMELLRPGGTLLIDNVLWAGLVAYDEPGDNIGRALRKFNEYVFAKYGAYASIVPAWDGMIFVVKPTA